MTPRLPNFLLLGAARSGTTAAYGYLSRHPSVFLSAPKEPRFFSNDERFARGIEFYARHFEGALPNQRVGEATTDYGRTHVFPEAPRRIRDALDHPKLVYFLRHPVDRAYSDFVLQWMLVQYGSPSQVLSRDGKPIETFEDHIERSDFCLGSSRYLDHIEAYLAHFDRSDFLPVLFEEFVDRPRETLDRLQAFLGLEPIDLTRGEPPPNPNQRRHPGDEWMLSRYAEWFKSFPFVDTLKHLVPKPIRRGIVRGASRVPALQRKINALHLPPPMKPETRRFLLDRFREPNRRLARFLNRDLPHWES